MLVDLDLDGDLDLAVTSGKSGNLFYYENIGSGFFENRDAGKNPLQWGNFMDGAGSYGIALRSTNAAQHFEHATVLLAKRENTLLLSSLRRKTSPTHHPTTHPPTPNWFAFFLLFNIGGNL